MVNIYKGHTLALGTRDHFNARFYLFNNRYTVFITKILFIVFIYSLIYRCRLESRMPIHMQVLKWNWKRTAMYKTIITVSSKYTFLYLAPLILLVLFFLIIFDSSTIVVDVSVCRLCCTAPIRLHWGGLSSFLSFSFVPSFSRSLPLFVSQLSVLPLLLRVLLYFTPFFRGWHHLG